MWNLILRGVSGMSKKEKLEFSVAGFIHGCFYFFFSFVFLHASWIGNSFESPLSILVTIYLGICTWALSYTLKNLDWIIDFIIEKPLGHVILLFVYLVLYFVSPVVYIWLKFFNKE